ncbi:conserved hypothetical protein [Ricinus communis]|uniref:Uncharacterized protein n=1 Tax=Ricinus communis TaxID=3988 RepID=B9SKT0_RICCO|nr:conserved hypothetical protein [Ricinus communis]
MHVHIDYGIKKKSLSCLLGPVKRFEKWEAARKVCMRDEGYGKKELSSVQSKAVEGWDLAADSLVQELIIINV